MAQGAATAADVPGKYDVVINGFGYQVLDTIEPSLPFRSHRAIYSYTPTFVERTNLSNTYGDNAQAFWLTASQDDWSLGEQQRFNRQTDATSRRRYWRGNNINVGWTPGQISMEYGPNYVSLGFSAVTCIPAYSAYTAYVGAYQCARANENTNLSGTLVHGASLTSSQAVCSDGQFIYIGDNTHIRKWDVATTFTTFSSTSGSSCLAYVSNTLFSCYQNKLSYFDTLGNANLVYAWVSADGSASTTRSPQPQLMTAYGGQVMVVVVNQPTGGSAELWLADTTGASRVAALPNNFVPQDICLADEIVFISGTLKTVVGVNANFGTPAVFYYANGNIGKLWQSKGNAGSPNVSCAPLRGGIAIADPTQNGGAILYYDIAAGGISSIASYVENSGTVLAGGDKNLSLTTNTSQGWSYFSVYATTASTAYTQTSLFDFDSSLTKVFRGITVDWSDALDAGGTVDIGYQVANLDGTWTSLASSVVSGQEYTLPSGLMGRSIAAQVTMHRGSSTWGPLIKRIYVRAAPLLQTYRDREYILDLSGIGFKDPVELNDESFHPLSGHEQATNLFNAFTTSTPFTITDRFGSFTGLCEPAGCEIYETREGNDSPTFSGGFVAKVTVREI
jgi:hypothetical protein